ncbi:hypothetical protein [Pedobacter nyackensis]|uniref:Uncharacterized protein n=1 Tax=Pedobacter nyackensis TaxID=475255 RepID=A0A1W1ZXU6_9SPHI|nr:hypothetical protein [Pedobacter nyackensis]SMC53032.1 hypothetical protein SAMN04488101_101124 [Pedobacter nyackensis]
MKAQTTVKPTQEEGNILLSEFKGVKFQARRDNQSYDKKFDTYAECIEWIEEKGYEDFYPEIGFGSGVGNHHDNWSSLMAVVEKIESLGYDSRIHGNYSDGGFLCDFVDLENNEHGGSVSYVSKIEAVFDACVQLVGWLKLRQKGGGA